MNAWCLYLLLGGFAVWWALFLAPVRRPAAVEYPSDDALLFSESN